MGRESNVLTIWGNKESMNLNSMILTNIQSSTYFKQKLYELKTYHEVIDEIYYRVTHLEPWEKGSRRTQGLTGMCGGVRGVGGGGIVSTAFCLLYKLYTLKLTRKQVVGLMTHTDSPYIRALGFMYVRYTQNPQDLFNWYYDYLDDEEEIDVKAGGGLVLTIGQMLRQWLTRLEWFDTLFPRIPVPIQKEIMDSLRERYGNRVETAAFYEPVGGAISREVAIKGASKRTPPPEIAEIVKQSSSRSSRSTSRNRSRSRSQSKSNRRRSRSGSRRSRSRSRSLKRKSEESPPRRSNKKRHHRSRSRSHSNSSRSSSSSRERHRHRHRHHHHKKKSERDDTERHRHRHHRKHRDSSRNKSQSDDDSKPTSSSRREDSK